MRWQSYSPLLSSNYHPAAWWNNAWLSSRRLTSYTLCHAQFGAQRKLGMTGTLQGIAVSFYESPCVWACMCVCVCVFECVYLGAYRLVPVFHEVLLLSGFPDCIFALWLHPWKRKEIFFFFLDLNAKHILRCGPLDLLSNLSLIENNRVLLA